MSHFIKYRLREAESNVIGFNLLSELDETPRFFLPVVVTPQALALSTTFISSEPNPGKEKWDSGTFSLQLEVSQAPAVLSYAFELWRTDLDGNETTQIATQTATQTGAGTKTFTFILASSITAVKTDRLKLELYTANSGSINEDLFINLALSRLSTPLRGSSGSIHLNHLRGGRTNFLNKLVRPVDDGEPSILMGG